jgi:hypothetical protein
MPRRGLSINPKNAFIGVGLFFENRQEARKPGLLPPGKSLEAVCERPEPQERKERVFKRQPAIDDFNCIICVNISRPRLLQLLRVDCQLSRLSQNPTLIFRSKTTILW